jgi:hypothetical protein
VPLNIFAQIFCLAALSFFCVLFLFPPVGFAAGYTVISMVTYTVVSKSLELVKNSGEFEGKLGDLSAFATCLFVALIWPIFYLYAFVFFSGKQIEK